MTGLLYKCNSNGDRISKNVKASFDNAYGSLFFTSESFEEIDLNKNDYFFYSDDDIEINKQYQVVKVISSSKIEAK